MSTPLTAPRPLERAPQERLDSWKAIAAYLGRDVTTVQRWERREGMPVHRHVHQKRGSVYALASELDAWRQRRGEGIEREAERPPARALDAWWRPWGSPTAVGAGALLALALYVAHRNAVPHADLPRSSSPAAMAGEPAGERRRAGAGVAPEVYEHYLRGIAAETRAPDRERLELSIRYFKEAIRLDPSFAPAYIGLAGAFLDLGSEAKGVPPSFTRPQVLANARRALELDPSLVDAHAMLANVLQQQWRWTDAELEHRAALELNPKDGLAQAGFALWLLAQGRTAEAIDWVRRGRRLDPQGVTGSAVACVLFHAHRFDEAIHELQTVLAMRPEDAHALYTMGMVLSAEQRAAEAIPFLQKSLAIAPDDPATMGMLIRAYASAGRRADAVRLLDEMQRRSASSYVPAGAFVNAYLGLGSQEQAFAWLERAFREQSGTLQFIKVDPFFDPIRRDPRFADLVRRIFPAPAAS